MNFKVPFVNYPLHYQLIWTEIHEAITQCFNNGDLILRDAVKQFEDNIASFVGVKHAVAVNSGSDALLFALKANDVGKSDEIITVAHTFVASIAAIIHAEAKPILVDIGEDMNMNVDLIEHKITKQTKAIMPVHLNGRLCNMDKIQALATEHDLAIVEDAAQALGASYHEQSAGSFGVGCFSFYPAKILGCAGDGGILTTNRDEVAEKARLLRDHGQDRATGEIQLYGFNSRLDNLQAAILNVKMKYLPQWIARRRYIAGLYEEGLNDLDWLKLPPSTNENGFYCDVYQNYVIRTNMRDKLQRFLEKEGVETMVSWRIPNHLQESLGLYHFQLPETERTSNEVLSLPMYPELTDEQVKYVCELVRMLTA